MHISFKVSRLCGQNAVLFLETSVLCRHNVWPIEGGNPLSSGTTHRDRVAGMGGGAIKRSPGTNEMGF